MAGPWEQYAPTETGPWTKYGSRNDVAPPADTRPELQQRLTNMALAGLSGAGSIGSTLIELGKSGTGQGAQPFGSLSGRIKARNAATEGGAQELGADPNSLAYGATKLITEVAGTAGVGGGLARGLAAVPWLAQKIPALIAATRTAGMSAGGVGGATGVGARIAGGGITGAASAALVNPDDAAQGGVIGAVLPPVAQVVGKVGQALGGMTKAGGTRNAVEKISDTLGGDVRQAIGDIQTYYPRGAENIPVSAAAITKNPALAQLEQGSRLRTSAPWYEFDQTQGKAVYDNVLKATDEASDIGARATARRDNWTQAWSMASAAEKPRVWAKRMGQLGGDIEQSLQSAEASNPAVKNVLEAIKAEVIRIGPEFSPGHLQQLRANLSGRAKALPQNAFEAAPRDSKAVRDVISEMDDILNATTGGKWQKVLDGYTNDSISLSQAKAASKVRGSFLDETGRVRKVSVDPAGDVPKITEAGLGGALDAARLPDKSSALSEPALARLEATLEAIRRQNILQGVKRTASAGGGSDTASNLAAVGAQAFGQAAIPGHGGAIMSGLLGGLRRFGTGRTDDALAGLLSNPDELARALGLLVKQRGATNPYGLLGARVAPLLGPDQ